MSFEFSPHAFACFNFLKGNEEKRATAVIVPLKLIKKSGNGENYLVVWSCNLGKQCENPSCRYSQMWEQAKLKDL